MLNGIVCPSAISEAAQGREGPISKIYVDMSSA